MLHTKPQTQPPPSLPHLVPSPHLPGFDLLPEVMELLQVQPPRAICLEEGQGYRVHTAESSGIGRGVSRRLCREGSPKEGSAQDILATVLY